MEGFTPVEDDPQVVALKARSDSLDQKIANLQAEVDAKRQKVLTMFRDTNAPKFEGFNWKGALAGAAAELPFKVAGMTVYLKLATGQTAQKVTAYLQELNGPISSKVSDSEVQLSRRAALLPVTPAEVVMLQRVSAVLAGDKRLDLEALDFDNRLQRVRTFSDVLTQSIVSRCELLDGWLSAQMELELGN